MPASIVTVVVKTTEEKNRVLILLGPQEFSEKFVPGTTMHSYRFEKMFANRRDLLGKEMGSSGAVAKIVVKIHASQLWIDKVVEMTQVEYDAACKNEQHSFIFSNVQPGKIYSLSIDDSEKIKNEMLRRKSVDWSKISENAKRLFEVSSFDLTKDLSYKPFVYDDFVKEVEKVSPKNPDYFYIAPQSASAFYSVGMMLKSGSAAIGKILMVGPSGWGKTSLPKHFAKINKLKTLRMDCAKIRDPEEWFGMRGAVNGTTVFVKSDFVSALEAGNVVIILDEINRIEPYIANTLFPILDDSGEITINNELIRAGKNVLIVGTINVGFEYSGTFSLDAALANRFDVICPATKIPMAEEIRVLLNREGISYDVASLVVETAEKVRALRTVDCSMRTTLSIAKIISSTAAGKNLDDSKRSIRTAFQHVVIDRASLNPDGDTRQLIDTVNAQLGAFSDKKVNLQIF